MSASPFWQRRDMLLAVLLAARFGQKSSMDSLSEEVKSATESDVVCFMRHGDESIFTPEELSYIKFADDTWNY